MADAFTDEVQRRINALPEDIREFVYSADMNKVVQEIGRKNGLHIDQMGALESEAAAAMIGITKPEDFAENVGDALSLDEQKAAAVARDVNDMLFIKIRESMKMASGAGTQAAAGLRQPAPASAVPAAASAPAGATPVSAAAPPATAVFQPPAVSTPITPAKTEPKLPVISAADVALTEKTISKPPAAAETPLNTTPQTPAAAKQEPPKPAPYKADPYREPIEP